MQVRAAGWWASPWTLGVAAAAWFGGLASIFGVPARLGQDPYGYFDLARSLAVGHGFMHGHPWESVTPTFAPGYPAVLAAFFALLGPNVFAARAATIVFAALCPTLVLLLGRAGDRAASPAGGRHALQDLALISAVFLASCPLLARASLTLMSDGLAVTTLLAASVCAIRFAEAPSAARGAALGLAAASAAVVRYACAPISILIVFYAAVRWVRTSGARPAIALVAVGVGALPIMAMSLTMAGWDAMASHPVGSLWSPLRAFSSSADGPDGRLDWGGPLALVYLSDLARPGIVGPALAVMAVVGAIAGPRPTKYAAFAWVAASFVVVLGLPEHNTRFWMLSLPPVAVLGAFGVMRLRGFARTVAIVVVALGGLVGSAREARRMGEQGEAEQARIDLVRDALRDGTRLRVFTLELSPPLSAHLPETEVLEADASSNADWTVALERPGRCLLLLKDGAEAQWHRTAAWQRIVRVRERVSTLRESKGGASAYDVRCGSP